MVSKKELAYNAKLKHANPLDLMFGGEDSDSSESQSLDTTNLIIARDRIKLDPTQPRRYFDVKRLEELAHSISELGILEPLLVRLSQDGYYELIAGERRFKASELAGLKELPCIVKKMNDDTVKQVRLIENLQREDLNAYEETIGILELLTLRLKNTQEQVISLLNRMEKANRDKTDNVIRQKRQSKQKERDSALDRESVETIENVFALIGRLSPESFRTNRLPLLNLPSDIQQALAEGLIEYTKARTIAKGIAKLTDRLKIDEERQRLLQEAIENNLSLSDIQQRISKLLDQEKGYNQPSLKQEYKDLSKQLGSSKIWNDPKKKKTLEKLLNRLKILLLDDS